MNNDNDKADSYDSRQTLELARMVLNQSPNVTNDPNNIIELLKTYSRVFKNDVSLQFQESLVNSMNVIDTHSSKGEEHNNLLKSELNRLEPNNKDSCIILPIKSLGHMLSGVVKNNNEGYTLTVVNKGDRPKDIKPIEEFKIKECDMFDLLEGLEQKSGNHVSEIYEIIKNKAYERNTPSKQLSEQKGDNCHVKEPENALKYAISNSSTGRGKKWTGRTTKEVHESFVEELKNEHPYISKELDKELKLYTDNKRLNSILTKNYISDLIKNREEIDSLIDNISFANLKKNSGKIFKYLVVTNQMEKGSNLAYAANVLSKGIEIRANDKSTISEREFTGIKQCLNEVGKTFKLLEREFKMELSSLINESEKIHKIVIRDDLAKGTLNIPALKKMERLFQQAMELNPRNTYAMKQHGTFLNIVVDYKELNDRIKQPTKNGLFSNIGTYMNSKYTSKRIRERADSVLRQYNELCPSSKIEKALSGISVDKKVSLADRRKIKEDLMNKGQYTKSNNRLDKSTIARNVENLDNVKVVKNEKII